MSCLTTPADPSDAVEQGIRELEERMGKFVVQLDEVIHGTTLVINSIIERKGARTGLIKPLIPRHFRLEVDERIRSDGNVLKPLDRDHARAVVRQLLDMGVESIAVCLIN